MTDKAISPLRRRLMTSVCLEWPLIRALANKSHRSKVRFGAWD